MNASFPFPSEMSHVSEPASSNDKDNTARSHIQPHLSKPTTPLCRSLPIDTKYPESALRTPLYALPFPHPKWVVESRTGKVYEDTSLMIEALRADLGDVRESIECVEEGEVGVMKRKKLCEKEIGEEDTTKRIRSEIEDEEQDGFIEPLIE